MYEIFYSMLKPVYFLVIGLFISISSMAQEKTSFIVESLPEKLDWIQNPMSFTHESGTLSIQSGPKTDMFIDPMGEYIALNAPRAVFRPDQYFKFSAKVHVNFNADFDAGVLILYANETQWAKLCFEFSPQKEPMVVSVVTSEISDDANSSIIDGSTIFLRISGLGKAYAFHYSHDGEYWHFVRYFHMETKDPIRIGFSSQSPTGEGCSVKFTDIEYLDIKLDDLRNGS